MMRGSVITPAVGVSVEVGEKVWVGMYGTNVGGADELVSWHPLNTNHNKNKSTALLIICWMDFTIYTISS
jgi:hypothetical protein